MTTNNWKQKLSSWIYKPNVGKEFPTSVKSEKEIYKNYYHDSTLNQTSDFKFDDDLDPLANPNDWSYNNQMTDIKNYLYADCWGIEKIMVDGTQIPLLNSYNKDRSKEQKKAEKKLRMEIVDDFSNFWDQYFDEGDILKIHMHWDKDFYSQILFVKTDQEKIQYPQFEGF